MLTRYKTRRGNIRGFLMYLFAGSTMFFAYQSMQAPKTVCTDKDIIEYLSVIIEVDSLIPYPSRKPV